MRVIAGAAKGRRLRAVPGMTVRPTADRVREALFSIVLSRFELAGARVLDLYAGTGSVGIEALSRGSAYAVFVEHEPRTRRVLQDNITQCGFAEQADVVGLPVRRALAELARRGARFDGIFIDPPYQRGLADDTLRELVSAGITGPSSWVMVERHADDALDDRYGDLRLTQTRRYGKTVLALYGMEPTSSETRGG